MYKDLRAGRNVFLRVQKLTDWMSKLCLQALTSKLCSRNAFSFSLRIGSLNPLAYDVKCKLSFEVDKSPTLQEMEGSPEKPILLNPFRRGVSPKIRNKEDFPNLDIE